MMKNGNQDRPQIRNAGENARADLPKLNALDVILAPRPIPSAARGHAGCFLAIVEAHAGPHGRPRLRHAGA
jgi:hypothetical protein